MAIFLKLFRKTKQEGDKGIEQVVNTLMLKACKNFKSFWSSNVEIEMVKLGQYTIKILITLVMYSCW
jgi:hypothetical protein